MGIRPRFGQPLPGPPPGRLTDPKQAASHRPRRGPEPPGESGRAKAPASRPAGCAPSPRFDRTKPELVRPPSFEGQHTDEVMANLLGRSADEIAVLRAAGAFGPTDSPQLEKR